MRVRALVLAAGHGTRLRPLTGSLPKPLLPVLGRPLIGHTLERLEHLGGVETAAINLHHLGERIQSALGSSYGRLPLHFSLEGEAPLGTAGAFHPLLDFLEPAEAILVVNGDSLCRWPLRRLLRRLRRGADACLLLSKRADPSRFGGGVGVDAGGRVVDFRPGPGSRAERRYVFAGAHAMSPRLLERLAATGTPADLVRDVYEPLLEAGGRVEALVTATPWHDLGTPARYLDAVLDWARGRLGRRLPEGWWRRRYVARDARRGAGARIVASVVESGAAVGRDARVERSLLLGGSVVGDGCRLARAILGPGVSLPSGSTVENRLVTTLRAGRHPAGSDSVLGDLVFTPIDPVAVVTGPL